ncbi:MAG: 5-deoxy-glucuronate isomerase [Phycicoccus sp.]|nr:5-deoxy-glucuronate isomerase [Phycicoccus sp.]
MSIGADNDRWVQLAGSTATDGWDVAVRDDVDGWSHTGLYVATLTPDECRSLDLGVREAVVVPLAGSCDVTALLQGEPIAAQVTLAGRESVWSGPTDVVYVPPGAQLTLCGRGPGISRVAVLLAADPEGAGRRHSLIHLPAAQVPVELRGAGIASRQVRNFGIPGVLDAGRMIACEVITPAGNWSSWPPHKHDEERPGVESELEEIYYFQTRSTDERGTDPVGYQRVYAAGDRPIDVVAEVRTDDVVLVPHGWHGPAVAAPDADLYYLNVMAGPGSQRAWLICDDPAHAWVRETWADQPIDPRVT